MKDKLHLSPEEKQVIEILMYVANIDEETALGYSGTIMDVFEGKMAEKDKTFERLMNEVMTGIKSREQEHQNELSELKEQIDQLRDEIKRKDELMFNLFEIAYPGRNFKEWKEQALK